MASACTLFVANLSYSMTEDDLYKVFEEFGKVSHAKIAFDRESLRSRGFGYVTFDRDSDARAAIDQLNNSEVHGRPIKVEISRPRPPSGDYPRSYGRPPRRDFGRSDNYRDDQRSDNFRRESRGSDRNYDRPRYDNRSYGGREDGRDY